MTRYAAISYACALSRDHQENTRNHQGMLDEISAEIRADGWAGAQIIDYCTFGGSAAMMVEPGGDTLTLDLLRQFREEKRQRAQQEPDQKPLFN